MAVGCVHVFCHHGRMESPWISYHTRGRLFNLPKGKHVLKHAESHRCEVNALRILACNFSVFLRFLKAVHVRIPFTESKRSDRF